MWKEKQGDRREGPDFIGIGIDGMDSIERDHMSDAEIRTLSHFTIIQYICITVVM